MPTVPVGLRELDILTADLAVLRAFFEERVTPTGEGEPIELSGSWIVVLKRQADGS